MFRSALGSDRNFNRPQGGLYYDPHVILIALDSTLIPQFDSCSICPKGDRIPPVYVILSSTLEPSSYHPIIPLKLHFC